MTKSAPTPEALHALAGELVDVVDAMADAINLSVAVELATAGVSDKTVRSALGHMASLLVQRLREINEYVESTRTLLHGDRDDGDEESAGDVKASGGSGTASAISDHLDAVEDFAETLVVSVAPSVEMHDKVLGGSVHRLAREIVSRLEAIDKLRAATP